ncbi:MAG: 2-succinyl-5-enolpyruvyl-6-hydroxy-3-cyclohexene-1-carboxylic-acid synthase [Candidatus Eisenbacteria bacterium]
MPSKTPDARKRPEFPAGGSEEDAGVGALNVRWALAFTHAMAAAGVRDAVVAPGSRSAPIALALDRTGIRVHIAIDERAGAFFALGLAKSSRRPVAILTTSGTAAANLHPAALEAHHGRVPLLLLTADRPPELRGTGAPQTIDQTRLFGPAAIPFLDAGTPLPGEEGLRSIASLAARAVAAAWGPPAGSVHVNLAFREPLLPDAETMDAIAFACAVGKESAAEPPERIAPATAEVERAARALRGRRRGLLVCGPEDGGAGYAESVARLAAITGYPVLADPLSGLRFGDHDRSRVHAAYDLFLRSPSFLEGEAPEAIVQFGATLTSKPYHLYAERYPRALRLMVDVPGSAWRDPARRVRAILTGDPALTALALGDALALGAEPLSAWGESFARAERAAAAAVENHVGSSPALGEEGVFPALLDALPDGATLYVGNSMAIRDLDLSARTSSKRLRVLGNRGVNGIDGVVSSALGASAWGEAPLLAVVGDLSFHHDLNALAAIREGRARATIVVVNNDGGGIFSFLPVASHGDAFEHHFGTPHGLDLARAAALYGVPHACCTAGEELRARAAASLAARATTILEVRTERAANREAHRVLAAAAIRAVEKKT